MADIQYNVNTDLILADSLFIFVDDMPLAFAQSANLSFSADSIDTSNKMSPIWVSNLQGKLSYTITSDALITKKEGAMSFDTLLDKATKREPVNFVFGKASEDGTFSLAEGWYEGTAIITALDINSENNAVASMSVTLTGSGELKKVTQTGA